MSRVPLCIFMLLALMHCSSAQTTGDQASAVGQISFENSGAAAAQGDFLAAVAQLHNFEYEAAADLFRKAQQADPGFAMAYWGEAMTHNHPIWMEQDRDAARGVLARLGETADARLAKAPTPREKDYLRTLDVLFGDGDKDARDRRYADAMLALARAYPDDVDANAFAALALLGTAHEGREFSIYMRAAAMLEPFVERSPQHPGLRHYLIHSFDDPIHAPLGLRAAAAYSTIAPKAAHAQHMCSHIFMALGMWDDVVAANETAIALTRQAAADRPPSPCGHYPFWLMYGYLQQGRNREAHQMVLDCQRAAAAGDGAGWAAFASMRSRYLIDAEEWTSDLVALQVPPGNDAAIFTSEYANGFVAVRRGDLPAARRALSAMEAARRTLANAPMPVGDAHAGMATQAEREARRRQIMRDEIGIMLGSAEGAVNDGIRRLAQLAPLEDDLPYEFGPPAIDKPTWELLGEMYLRVVDTRNARLAFEKSLRRAPGRVNSLEGLLEAVSLAGDESKRAEIRTQLEQIRRRADRKPPIGR